MKRARHTFTLVEILTVAAMICLIMSAILVAYNGVYRSWATGNTIAAMKSAHLALGKFKQQHGFFPQGSDTLGKVAKGADKAHKFEGKNNSLVHNLLQDCSPYSFMNGDVLMIFDDFGNKPNKNSQSGVKEIYYACSNQNDFKLMSMGKDGDWGGNDDIVYLPYGDSTYKPGFYRCTTSGAGGISGEVEPLSE